METLRRAISSKEFHRVAALVYENAGIRLGENKREMVVARLGRRMRSLGVGGVGQYLERVDADPSGAELTRLVNAITTNTTEFFREPRHFSILERVAVELSSDPSVARRGLRVWSAACSTGEEPYTI